MLDAGVPTGAGATEGEQEKAASRAESARILMALF